METLLQEFRGLIRLRDQNPAVNIAFGDIFPVDCNNKRRLSLLRGHARVREIFGFARYRNRTVSTVEIAGNIDNIEIGCRDNIDHLSKEDVRNLFIAFGFPVGPAV